MKLDITTLDPLNLVLIAPSKKWRIIWGIVAVVDVIALICVSTILVLRYQNDPTKVVTNLKYNRVPFPAVTFCNLNPYKKSALIHIPEVAELIKAYQKASGNPPRNISTVNPNPIQSRRRKRGAEMSCNCNAVQNVTTAKDPSISPYLYARYTMNSVGVNWTCSYECCDVHAPCGMRGRTVIIDKPELIPFLVEQGLLNATGGPIPGDFAWIGLFSAGSNTYHWYHSPTTVSGGVVDTSKICNSNNRCIIGFGYSSWSDPNIAVAISYSSSVFLYPWKYNSSLNVFLCEFYEVPTTSSCTTTANPVSAANPATTPSESTAYFIAALNDALSDENAASAISADIFPYITASLPPSLLSKAAYNISEILMRCVYNGVACYESDFKLQSDPAYGNCFAFNADGKHMALQKSGISGGLSISYAVDQTDYLDFIQASGARIVISGQNVSVFPDTFGISVPGGYHSIIAMKQSQISSLPSSHKPCADQANEVPIFNFGSTYSVEACLRSCYQGNIISRCQCGDPRVPLPPATNVDYCPVVRRDCVNIAYTLQNKSSSCICPPECSNNIYEITSSISNIIMSKVSTAIKQPSLNGRSSSAKIDIYFADFTLTEFVEVKAYDIFALLWDMSSIYGLFLGISVLSLFEIIDLLGYISFPARCRQ